ncbi:zinc carboxypeptidase-like [Culex pipiens pallens]|uniref:zinc carboxypeptidase-like n=1 Tax=Culex pipiens pallens TaxID=42434 RepID=UPI001952F1C3|nr:zinc carboxypeptidase-like [Culex pipiens pallens]
MVFNYRLLVLVVLPTILTSSQANRYDGFKLYELSDDTGHEVQLLQYLQRHRPSCDVWALSKLGHKRVLVPPTLQKSVEKFFADYHVNYTLQVEDFGRVYEARQKESLVAEGDGTFLNSFPTYEEINEYLMKLAMENFEWIRIRVIGWSVEGRPIRAITINPKKQDTIIVDAGVHAREWITVSAALYLIKKLIDDSDQYRMFHEYKWVIVPLVNPDGYMYSMSTDRYWRKNRRRYNGTCGGVDINRNFGYNWDAGAEEYASQCHAGYRGAAAFSEPETKALRSILDNNDEAKLYISLHSYGGYLIYPWTSSSSQVKNVANLRKVGVDAARAIWQYSKNEYKVGASSEILRYQATGTSIDYAYSVGIQLPFVLEIAEYGYSDFQPPAKAINELVKETFVGIKELVYGMRRLLAQNANTKGR